MARFIPGGYEDSDSDDLDDLVYTNDNLKRSSYAVVDPVVQTSNATDNGQVHNHSMNDNEADIDKKAFLWPPRPPESFRRSPSPSPGAVILDDIRVAVMRGNLDYVRKQVNGDSGFFVDTVLKSGWTCLMYAANCGFPDIVHYLLEENADPNWHKDMFTPLMAVCASNEEDQEKLVRCAEHLIKFGAKVNAIDRFLNTPLMIAAKTGKLSLVKLLLDHGADINSTDKHGWTALHWAAAKGKGPVVRYLIEKNADLTILTSSGQTAADVAYDSHFKEVGDILDRLKSEKGVKTLSDIEEKSLKTVRSHRPKADLNDVPVRDQRYVGDLEMFLVGLGLSEYNKNFEEHRITLRELIALSEEDLDKIGISKLGAKRKILEGIRKLHKAEWKRSSLPDFKDKAISCPDAVSMMTNINKHLAYIEATIAYLRHQVKKTPKILEYGQEAANVQNLIDEMSECLTNSRHVFDEAKFFGKDLVSLKNDAQLMPADILSDVPNFDNEIDEPQKVSFITTKRAFVAFAVGCTAVFVWKRYWSFLT